MQGQALGAVLDGPAQLSSGTVPPAEDSTLELFLRQVFYDGRFLDVVNKTPRFVADSLGIELSAADEALLKQSSLRDCVAVVYKKLAVGPVMIVAIAIVAVIAAVVVWKYSTKVSTSAVQSVIDRSPHASLKL